MKLGKESLKRLNETHRDIQLIMKLTQYLINEKEPEFDVTVLCGYRGEEEQNRLYKEGKSQLKYPHGKHDKMPSEAIDLAPYPTDWSNIDEFNKMCDYVKKAADILGIEIIQGRDWKTLKDYPHFELKN
jgi:peptidoglycan L-alanyl-D-glutamate endopeptidase CwlK